MYIKKSIRLLYNISFKDWFTIADKFKNTLDFAKV